MNRSGTGECKEVKESTYVNRVSDNKTMKIHARMITRKYRLHLDQTNLGLFDWHLFLNEKKTQRQMGYSSDGLMLGQMSCRSAQQSEIVWCLTLLIIIIIFLHSENLFNDWLNSNS